MATGGDPEPTDLYTCQVCLEDQTERAPRLLSCHHSFCETCIKKLVKSGKVECPTCRQVTLVGEDDVANLSINFMLLKVKDHVEKITPKKQNMCHVCKVMAADKKCQKCTNLLCDPCIKKHKKNKVFKGHKFVLVCPEHENGIIHYVCLKCFNGICSICLLNDHSEHKKDVVMYREGINKITESIQKMKAYISKRIKLTPEEKAKIQKKIIENQELQKDMEEKSEEMKKTIDKIKVQNENLMHLFSNNEEAMKLIEEMTMCLLEPDKTILKLYPILEKNKDKLLTMVEGMDQSTRHSGELENGKAQHGIDQSISNEKNKNATLVYKITDMKCLEIRQPTRIQCMTPTNAIVFDPESCRYATIGFTKTTTNPKIKGFHIPDDMFDMIYEDNLVYISSDKELITYSSWKYGSIMSTYKPNIQHMTKLFRKSRNVIIVFDVVLGRVYEYSLTTKTVKKILSDIHVDHIAVRNKGKGFVVTNTLDCNLKFYNKSWCFQKEINCLDRQIKCPSECVSTPFGLLVANTGNNCITLLDHQGELIDTCVLGEADGIRRPVSIDYMEPYLWIAEYDRYQGHRSIKCFELRWKG